MSVELMMLRDAEKVGKTYQRFNDFWTDILARQHVVYPDGTNQETKENLKAAFRKSAEDAWMSYRGSRN
jgi:hypothetical protein